MRPHDMEVYGTVKVGERGQVVIPSDAREALGIKAGDFLLVISTPREDGIVMVKAEIVKKMMQKVNLGLSKVDADDARKPAKRARRG